MPSANETELVDNFGLSPEPSAIIERAGITSMYLPSTPARLASTISTLDNTSPRSLRVPHRRHQIATRFDRIATGLWAYQLPIPSPSFGAGPGIEHPPKPRYFAVTETQRRTLHR